MITLVSKLRGVNVAGPLISNHRLPRFALSPNRLNPVCETRIFLAEKLAQYRKSAEEQVRLVPLPLTSSSPFETSFVALNSDSGNLFAFAFSNLVGLSRHGLRIPSDGRLDG